MNRLLLLIGLCILTGCAMAEGTDPFIKANPDSEYETTYKELGIGQIHDFHFTLPNADERWVRVWMEGYKNGEKINEPLAELSYGQSPGQDEEGHLGIGIIRGGGDGAMLHVYAPGVSLIPRESPLPLNETGISTWEHAVDEEGVNLVLGEEVLLGAYRQSTSGSIQTFDLQDNEQVKQMIHDDTVVLLLKMKVGTSEEQMKE
ncbi:hypothetical protein GLW00_06130 [Halobacillus litoralis]|uniref:Uncharacterized protein n=1 Tax=Halobacillus litoralis TaxID=45668 RepID=A0A845F9T2_9BACI|nr:hypothetical protein [Halobacillus litoralis]MYL70415.1 hypothetical protein [Halobacillus litoralis]